MSVRNTVLPVMPVVHELTAIRQVAPHVFEEVDGLAIADMVANCPVSANKLHIAVLTSPEVVEKPIVVPPIGVSELLTALPGDDQNERNFRRSEDSALSLDLG